jgi:TrmH family RNA methyltransferase
MNAVTDTVTAQGILAIVRRRSSSAELLLRAEKVESVLVALDGVSDPGNLGSIIRTCDWFGVQGILLGNNCVELFNPKVLRGTMGSVFHLPVAERVDLLPAISRARTLGYTVYVTDPAGVTHFDRVRYSGKAVIVFGNEAWGVSDQLKNLGDVRVAIRRYGAAESLNVAVACGIMLSGLHRLYDE